jgi:hypothetical protein
MNFLYCPKCGIRRFHLKNSRGETVLVHVTTNYEIVPAKEGESIEGFDTETLYCLGCSWTGGVDELRKVK